MTTEQKAKAYDKALKVLHKYDGAHIMFTQDLKEEMFPELKESEDERIRKALIKGFNKLDKSAVWYNSITNGQILAWLEKQGEHANFRNKIQVGDKVTRNQDGMLVNLSQLNRVAKVDEKQGKQKPILDFKAKDWYVSKVDGKIHNIYQSVDKVEPKFKIGDTVKDPYGDDYHIVEISNDSYKTDDGRFILFENEDAYSLWTIKDAKDGDVLMSRAPFIYGRPIPYGGLDWYNEKFIKASNYVFKDSPVHPATKEQRDLLFQKMKEAGYEWDAEKKELKKI